MAKLSTHVRGGSATARVRAAMVLRRIVHVASPVGVEVGVYQGAMSCALLSGNAALRLYLVDNWLAADKQPAVYRASQDYHSKLSASKQAAFLRRTYDVTRCYGERCVVLVLDSVVAAARFENAQCDFVFLDADHTYEGVMADFAAWWPKIKPGGWLCGHDYGGWLVLPTGNRPFEVKPAVDEMAERLGLLVEVDEDYTWFMQKPQQV